MTMIAEKRKRNRTAGEFRTLVFSTDLGWMALVCELRGVRELYFGYSSQVGLRRQRNIEPTPKANWSAPERLWVDQLQRFARGEAVGLSDIPIVMAQGTEFQRAVLKACRAIRRGATMTYGELACQIGSPGAARAVGTVMSRNVLPLLIPCHRVLGQNGLGGYSAPRGLAMKRRLLKLESETV